MLWLAAGTWQAHGILECVGVSGLFFISAMIAVRIGWYRAGKAILRVGQHPQKLASQKPQVSDGMQ